MSISDLLKFGGKKPENAPGASADAPAPKGPDPVIPSKALAKFIGALAHHEAPVLIDFGPVIGTNVAFFGVLCWDIFDFLDPKAARALAREIVRVLRPGGAVMGFFCTKGVDRSPFTKYEILEASSSLRHRHHPGTGGAKFVLQNRDIIKMFDGLFVAESFLLKSNTREILLRKRA